MKLYDREVPKLKKDVFVLVREDGDYPIIIEPVNMADFETAYPRPDAPQVIRPGSNKPIDDLEDPGYKANMKIRSARLSTWLIINSIRNTPGLVWDKVDYSDPESWDLYESELLTIMTNLELTKLISQIMSIQGVTDSKVEEARKRFLASLAAGEQIAFTPNIEQ